MSRAGGRHRALQRRRRRLRRPRDLSSRAIFNRTLQYAPNTRRGKIVFKWDESRGDYDTSGFNSYNVLSEQFQAQDLHTIFEKLRKTEYFNPFPPEKCRDHVPTFAILFILFILIVVLPPLASNNGALIVPCKLMKLLKLDTNTL